MRHPVLRRNQLARGLVRQPPDTSKAQHNGKEPEQNFIFDGSLHARQGRPQIFVREDNRKAGRHCRNKPPV
jgi:hypothetical protein